MLPLLVNPTVAYLLLILGFISVLVEISQPGIGFAGAFGTICLVLALFALGALNANFAGLLLIALAFGLFLLDVKAQTHGVLILAGLLAFVAGSGVLFSTTAGGVPWLVILGAGGVSALVFVGLVGAGLQARLRPVVTGREGLVGQVGEVRTPLTPEGQIFVWGSLWRAVTLGGPVAVGQRVRVERVDGLTLYVQPIVSENASRAAAGTGVATRF